MKLNYRDKVVLITVLVVLVWVAGVMLFIRPKFQDLNAAKTELSSKKVELKDKEDRVAADKDLPQRVTDALGVANNVASHFYPKLTSDEVSSTVDDLLDKYEIINEDLSISTYSSVVLQAIYANVDQVQTPLDDLATTPLEGLDENAAAVEPVVTQITMPCYTVAFSFISDLDKFEDFLDELIMEVETSGEGENATVSAGTPKSLVVTDCEIIDINGYTEEDNVDSAYLGKVSGTVTMVLMMVPELQNPLEDPSSDKADEGKADEKEDNKEADKGSED